VYKWFGVDYEEVKERSLGKSEAIMYKGIRGEHEFPQRLSRFRFTSSLFGYDRSENAI